MTKESYRSPEERCFRHALRSMWCGPRTRCIGLLDRQMYLERTSGEFRGCLCWGPDASVGRVSRLLQLGCSACSFGVEGGGATFCSGRFEVGRVMGRSEFCSGS